MPGPFTERAQRVQDGIGWADMHDAEAMGAATLRLAQFVTDLAREVDRINAGEAPKPAERDADEPHDFESGHGAPEGGLGPCAVCGYSRGAPIHG